MYMAESTKKTARRSTLKNRYFCKTTATDSAGDLVSEDSERIEFENPEYERPKGVTHEQKSPAMELFVATDKAYDIQARGTLDLVKGPFSKENDSWFKFVLVSVNGEPKLYIIYGNDDQNKHSVCFLYAMYENIPRQRSSKSASSRSSKSGSTKSASGKRSSSQKTASLSRSASSPRRIGFHQLMDQVIALDDTTGEPITEETSLIINLNREIYNKFRCMDVIVSGSATYLGQHEGLHILCINSKSGHYLPDLETLRAAVSEFFPQLFPSDWAFTVRENVTNMIDLEVLYGKENYKHYTGTCLTDAEIASLPELRERRKSKMLAEKSKKPGKK
jgi:hypothetical protein